MVIASRSARTALLALIGLPGIALAAPSPAPVHGPGLLPAAHVLRPTEGYYDDVFSLDATGQHLCAIRTDGATFSKIEIVDLASGAITGMVDLGNSDQVPESVELLPDGKSVLLVVRDSVTQRVWASVVDGGGRPVAKTPLLTSFGRASVGDGTSTEEPVLVGLEKRGGGPTDFGGEVSYTVSAFRLANLAPVGKPQNYRIGPGNALRGSDVNVVGFFDGFSRLLGERTGGYDKKQDFRRPTRAVVLDTLTGKVAAEKEIPDVFAWTRTTKKRAAQPNRTAFAQVNQDLTGLEVLDPSGEKLPVPLAVPFRLYDPTSVKDQEGPEKQTLYISVAVDPVNPDAVARKKTDLAVLDLYAVDLGTHKSRHRGRILLPRPVMWKAGHGKLVVLKRFKSFSRGGDELDLYDLP